MNINVSISKVQCVGFREDPSLGCLKCNAILIGMFLIVFIHLDIRTSVLFLLHWNKSLITIEGEGSLLQSAMLPSCSKVAYEWTNQAFALKRSFCVFAEYCGHHRFSYLRE